jgi:hypothetical protein
MAKNNKNTAVKTTSTAAVKIEAPALPAITEKLTREQWRLLTPEQKAARKLARAKDRPSARARLTRTTQKLARRAARMSSIFEGEIGRAFATIGAQLQVLVEDIHDLPETWTPNKVGVSTPRLAPGDIVRIHEKRRASFEGLLEADELDGLRVEKIVGKRLILRAESGLKLTLAANVVVKN